MPNPPGMAPGSKAGLPPRTLQPFASDGFLWIRYAQDAVETGQWRLRHTDFDNAPEGREVHWNSGFLWALIGFGWLDHVLTGRPLAAAIQHMADWVNPALLALTLVLGATWIFRAWGLWSATFFMLACVGSQSFLEAFALGYPDHHGQHNAAIVFCLLGLLLGGFGLVKPAATAPEKRSRRKARQQPRKAGAEVVAASVEDRILPEAAAARRRFVLAGIAAGIGLWVSAFTVAVVFAGIGIGAGLVSLVWGRRLVAGGARSLPELWRWWGGAAGLTSLVLYGLEYLPGHLGMRLEVNHPLHALLCVGLGECLCRVQRLFTGFGWPRGLRGWAGAVAGAAALLALPLALLVGRERWYLPIDPFMFRLHQHIVEFAPIWVRLGDFWGWHGVTYGGAVILLAGASLLLAVLPGIPLRIRAALWFLAGAGLVTTALFFWQVRWVLAMSSVWLVAAPALALGLAGANWLPPRWRAVPLVAFGVLLVGIWPIPALLLTSSPGWKASLTESDAQALLSRGIAQIIRQEVGPDAPVLLLAPPNVSTPAAYFGDFRAVGTLYWENLTGLRKAASLLASMDEAEALRQIQALGVTHLAFNSGSEFVQEYFSLLHPDLPSERVLDALGGAIVGRRSVPRWLRVMPFKVPEALRQKGMTTLVMAVDPANTVMSAYVSLAHYFFVNGNYVEAEKALRAALAEPEAGHQVRLLLAESLVGQDRTDDALVAFDEAIRAAPVDDRARLWFQAGRAMQQYGRWRGALEAYRRGLEILPSQPDLLASRAWLLATAPDDSLRNAREALGLAREAMARNPQPNPNVHAALAAALAENGDFAAALAELDQAEPLVQGNPAFLRSLAAWGAAFRASRPWREQPAPP